MKQRITVSLSENKKYKALQSWIYQVQFNAELTLVFCSAILFRYFIFTKKSCGAFIFIVGHQTQQKKQIYIAKNK